MEAGDPVARYATAEAADHLVPERDEFERTSPPRSASVLGGLGSYLIADDDSWWWGIHASIEGRSAKRIIGCEEQGQNCCSSDESEKEGYTDKICCSMDCDNSESNEPSPTGKSENGTNANGCCCPVDILRVGEKKPCCSPSKVNNSSAGGVLRLALHLRFLSPFSKKSSRSMQRSKPGLLSEPLSRSTVAEEERRFYLYNDIRVVFPQRHSDSDEGELRVEHDFPADPKYFDISN